MTHRYNELISTNINTLSSFWDVTISRSGFSSYQLVSVLLILIKFTKCGLITGLYILYRLKTKNVPAYTQSNKYTSVYTQQIHAHRKKKYLYASLTLYRKSKLCSPTFFLGIITRKYSLWQVTMKGTTNYKRYANSVIGSASSF